METELISKVTAQLIKPEALLRAFEVKKIRARDKTKLATFRQFKCLPLKVLWI